MDKDEVLLNRFRKTMITPKEIEIFCQLIFKISGIHIEQTKIYLLKNRLTPLVGKFRCSGFSELHAKAMADQSGKIKHAIIDAISTNETFFFRDNTPFDLLQKKIIPDMLKRRRTSANGSQNNLRFWSAACSTGQEVYSIAMTMVEMLPGAINDVSIFATDISDQAISQASNGMFSEYEVERGLPVHMRNKFFAKANNGWKVKDQLRSMAKFQKINLTKPFPSQGKFDVIFCRNVAIYFNQQDKVNLFRKLASVLNPDGVLLLGGSESLTTMESKFVAVRHPIGIFYQLESFNERQPRKKPVARQRKPVVPPRPKPKKRRPTSPAPRAIQARPKTAEKAEEIALPESSAPLVEEEPLASPTVDMEEQMPEEAGPLEIGQRQDYDSLIVGMQARQEEQSLLDEKLQGQENSPSLLEKIRSRAEEQDEEDKEQDE